jgi:hypothetical protein
MSFDPNGFFEAISAGLSRVPPGLIAAGLLAGPTVIWLILRFANPPDLAKREAVAPEIALWLCESCRSLNNDWRDRCYHCHRPADAGVAVTLERPATFDPGVGIAVGPGLPIGDERLGHRGGGDPDERGTGRDRRRGARPRAPGVRAMDQGFRPSAGIAAGHASAPLTRDAADRGRT